MTEDQLLLQQLSQKIAAEKKAREAWEARVPAGNWLQILDVWKQARIELDQTVDILLAKY